MHNRYLPRDGNKRYEDLARHHLNNSNLLAVTKGIGWDGFLGTRGSLMLDFVVLSMLIVLPAMAVSIASVRYGRRYSAHKWLQIGLGITLLVAVIAFEIEVRSIDWTLRARPSPYWVDGRWNDWVDYSLGIHLVFAVPTPFLWTYVIIAAWRKFPRPPRPNRYSPAHRRWARLAALSMTGTAATGWAFYWFAFVAT